MVQVTHFTLSKPDANFKICDWTRYRANRVRTNSLDGLDYVSDFSVDHAGENRKTYKPVPYRRGDRQVFRPPTKRFPVIRVQMQRTPMYRTANAGLVQRLNKCVTVNH